ncbi:MAG: hypothetical protein ACFFB2_01975 [Promethearchaeota archaeon]
MDSTKFNKNVKELTELYETGTLNRKSHWQKYLTAVKYARKAKLTKEDRNILGKIDEFFFDSWTIPKFSIKTGTILFSASVIIIESLYFLIFIFSIDFWFSIIIYFLLSFVNFILSHTLIHWIFGFFLGIRFRKYFIFKSTFRKTRWMSWAPIAKFPTFGIKYDLNSFLSVSKWKRSLMFISAPIFSWIWFLLNFIPLSIYYSNQILILQVIGVIILIIFVFSQLIGFFFYGDFWKARQDY